MKEHPGTPDVCTFDVAVVGGGPAGLSACLELAKRPDLRVALFESEGELGGIPVLCSGLFGLRDRGIPRSGTSYASNLDSRIRRTPAEIHLNATVMELIPGQDGEPHRLQVVSPSGFRICEARAVLLATGCYETPRDARMLPGPRPAGIFTTGMVQQLIRRLGEVPGRRAIIVGSEHVSLSCALTLKRAGVSIAAMIEEEEDLQTYPLIAYPLASAFGFPIHRGVRIRTILGSARVEGIRLDDARSGEEWDVTGDCLILTGRFRGYSPLIDHTPVGLAPETGGPLVDLNLMTPVPGIFAAGNVLHGAYMHDICALEGRHAAKNIRTYLTGDLPVSGELMSITAEPPIRYVVPQRVDPSRLHTWKASLTRPGPALQLSRTARHCALEAWSGDQRIWHRRYGKIVGSTRVPLPLHEFDWQRADRSQPITLRLSGHRA